MKTITPQALAKLKKDNTPHQLIDVREQHELVICSIGGQVIPMGDILANPDLINKKGQVIIHCRSGQRAASVIDALERHFGFDNLYNLEGGIIAYAEQIDNSIAVY